MSNFAGNQAVGGMMVMDMSSSGILHSWSISGVLDEVPLSLHQVFTDVSGYLNVPSPNCGSNLTKGMNNLSYSNKLVKSSSNLGIASSPKSSKKVEKKKNEVKTKKVASVNFLGMLFFMLLFVFEKYHGRVLTINGPMNGTDYSGKYDGIDHSSLCGRGGQGESNQQNTNKASYVFVCVGLASDPLAASFYVPRNGTLVKIEGNLIIQSVLAS
uniref:TGACG-sequence-specific DNA-binding protein TGA-1B n=1 Tax=Solanum tuberosum TaxID=4113 RepID=M1DE75_SOLTU